MTRLGRALIPVLLALAAPSVRASALQDNGAGAVSTLEGVYTAAQAARGEDRFRGVCAHCHGIRQFTEPGLFRAWNGRPLRDLFEMVRTLMPDDNPGGLERRAYADVMAYLLRMNGYPAGAAELLADDAALRRIRIEVKEDTAHR
jgi:mono/diheme cytochrome c family protein